MNHVLKSVVAAAFVATLALPNGFRQSAVISVQPTKPALSYMARMALEKKALTEHLSKKYGQPRWVTQEIVHAAYREGKRQGVSPLLLLAMAEKESSLRQYASNDYGALGLMQVVPRFHPEKVEHVGADNLMKPAVNMRVGAWILAEYLERFKGDLPRALVKYSGNARNYADTVERYRAELERVRARAQVNDGLRT